MTKQNPEQDPAEGAPGTIERELQRAGQTSGDGNKGPSQPGNNNAGAKPVDQNGQPVP